MDFAECFRPGMTEPDLGALDRRAETASGESLSETHYLGPVVIRAGDVVLC